MKFSSTIASLFTGLIAAAPVHAVDGYIAELGVGSDLEAIRVGKIRQWNSQWFEEGHWHLTGYWEGSLGLIHSARGTGNNAADLGITPVFRLRPNALGGTQPYWDVALGFHLLSRVSLDNKHKLGSALQLAPLVGVGVTFGEKSQFDLGYRFQHLNNAGLVEPNDGLSLHQVRLTFLY